MIFREKKPKTVLELPSMNSIKLQMSLLFTATMYANIFICYCNNLQKNNKYKSVYLFALM